MSTTNFALWRYVPMVRRSSESATLLIVLLAVSGYGCGHARDEEYASHRPKMADVVGIYEYTSSSEDTLPRPRAGQKWLITLNPNGTYVATGIPREASTSTSLIVRERGTWTFGYPFVGDTSVQGIEFTSHNASMPAALVYDSPPYELAFIIGDPDERDNITYQRIK